MYEIILYEDAQGNCPLGELIEYLDSRAGRSKDSRIQLKQIMFHLDLLERVGTRCPAEYVKHIQDDVWELRPGNNRILFFGWKGNKFVLLHSFRKTTNQTPRSEIEQAQRELTDWTNRFGY